MSENWHDQIVRQNKEHADWKSDQVRKSIADFEQDRKEKATADEILALKNKVKAYEELLSLPMKEIAQANDDFKKTYDQQQNVLAEWIMAQQAYRETAKIFGKELGKSKEEFSAVHQSSINAVLTNQTQHDNNASEYPVLADRASAILALRKKNGKA
ncbi:hypothetical protein [Burkholderia cenocepacia]|uniref:hypothetical protein n=1 Tax=Burkholderia cenocepacia TaxID=95486 RepID=UPI00068AC80D|nr:hypothetical protein [Burkholderia cenocepacia]